MKKDFTGREWSVVVYAPLNKKVASTFEKFANILHKNALLSQLFPHGIY